MKVTIIDDDESNTRTIIRHLNNGKTITVVIEFETLRRLAIEIHERQENDIDERTPPA